MITERSGRSRNATCPAEASIPECDEGSNPIEYSESLAPWVFHSRHHMLYLGWMCSYAFCLFLEEYNLAVAKKSRQQKNNEQRKQHAQRPAQRACTPHRTICSSESQPVYISAPSVGCGLPTALWLARHIIYKTCTMVTDGKTDTKNTTLAEYPSVGPEKKRVFLIVRGEAPARYIVCLGSPRS